MRENRLSGSEGRETELNRSSLPLSLLGPRPQAASGGGECISGRDTSRSLVGPSSRQGGSA